MATSSTWKDIDDKFCICSICLEQLQEPKLLPCLHRYCKDCLTPIIQGSYDVIICPECREEIEIPTNGVDGFKTDFYSKSLVEYVQIQQSLKSDQVRECFGCSKHLRVTAYCFKCNDFLCRNCYNFHVTNRTLRDHQKHTLSLEDIEGKKDSTVEKLSSMRDAPRCHIHLDEISKLCCETCGNLPICAACVYGEHKGHDLHEVRALANMKRRELLQMLNDLASLKKEKELDSSTEAKEHLFLDVDIEKEKVIKMHDEKDQKIMPKIQNIKGRIQEIKERKQNTEQKIFDSLQNEMEHEIQRVKKKYEDIFKVKKIEINDSFKAWESYLEKELLNLREKREGVHRSKKEQLESIEKQLNENRKTIQTMSEHFTNIRKRFESLNVMASGILASTNDWSAVQCIPDICTAATNLMKDWKKHFPELTALADVTVNFSCDIVIIVTKLSEEVGRKVNINKPYQHVNDVTSSGDGNIVLSGFTSDMMASFIIVIDVNGRILKEMKMKPQKYFPTRYCKFLSQYKVVSVCEANEVIGVFDVRDCSYMEKNIRDVIDSWPKGPSVACLATDPVKNHILLGGWFDSSDVYVFDDQLNYLHILALPVMIKRPSDMTVSDGHLLVCDFHEKKCYVTSIDGSVINLVGEFTKPNLEASNVGPGGVCTDKNGYIYVLWRDNINGGQRYLVQFNWDGTDVLTTRKVSGNAWAITVVETCQGEKLLVATYQAHTIYLYDLITEE